MNLKRNLKDKENPFLLPLPLFSPRRPNISFSPRTPRASGLFLFFPVRAQSAHSGPVRLSPPAQHSAFPLFFLRQRPTGRARPSGLSPTSSRGSAAPPSRRRPLPAASPAPLTFKHRNQAAMKPSLHSPSSIDGYPP
jgi:hypothetical protein